MSEYLTNERLKHKFESNFSLANFGIKIAKESIVKGDAYTLDEVLDTLEDLPNVEEDKNGD